MVEPPSQAAYVRAAYVPGTLQNYTVAFVSKGDTEYDSSRDRVNDEISSLMQVTSTPPLLGGAASPPVLGVIYSDGVLSGSAPADSARAPLCTIAVAVLGAATVVDKVFADRSQCTPGLFVHVNADGTLHLSASRTPSGVGAAAGRQLLGMLLEVGYHNDARILL